MTKKQKQILLQNISARLPFGVKALYKENVVDIYKIGVETDIKEDSVFYYRNSGNYGWVSVDSVKIYLRDY